MASDTCDYERTLADTIRCRNCGDTRKWNRADCFPVVGCGNPSPPSNCCGNNAPPPIVKRAWNLASAAVAFIREPGFVDRAAYSARLAICDQCERRDIDTCTECGCVLALKAAASAWHCPLGKWPGEANHLTQGQHA